MVMTEGKGPTAPKPFVLLLSDHDIRVLFDVAQKQGKKHEHRQDDWGKGLLQKKFVYPNIGVVIEPPHSATFQGKCGEYGLACYVERHCGIQVPIDVEVKEDGDGDVDLVIEGISFQVKARSKGSANLVKAKAAKAKIDAYVFCEFDGFKKVSVLGWLKTAQVYAHDLVNARRGVHSNFEVLDQELLPLTRLVEEIRMRRCP